MEIRKKSLEVSSNFHGEEEMILFFPMAKKENSSKMGTQLLSLALH